MSWEKCLENVSLEACNLARTLIMVFLQKSNFLYFYKIDCTVQMINCTVQMTLLENFYKWLFLKIFSEKNFSPPWIRIRTSGEKFQSFEIWILICFMSGFLFFSVNIIQYFGGSLSWGVSWKTLSLWRKFFLWPKRDVWILKSTEQLGAPCSLVCHTISSFGDVKIESRRWESAGNRDLNSGWKIGIFSWKWGRSRRKFVLDFENGHPTSRTQKEMEWDARDCEILHETQRKDHVENSHIKKDFSGKMHWVVKNPGIYATYFISYGCLEVKNL